MSELDADLRGAATSLPNSLELHDSLVVGVERAGGGLRLRMERVWRYEGDRLLRQEGGSLLLGGVQQSQVDGRAAMPALELEYGSVLAWSLDDGVGRFLIEWCAHSPSRHHLREWTFRYSACRWVAEFEHTD